jgi:glycerate dehydrogenase
MRAVILDADSLGKDIDLSPLQRDGLQWQVYPSTRPEETAARIAEAEIVVSNKVVLDATLLARAQKLKLVAVAATGTNNIDLQAASAHGISVCNCVDYGSSSVAQHVFTLMLALATNLPAYQNDVAAGRWQQSPFFCLLDHSIVELRGSTLGIIGYGNIGRAVADIAKAFGMNVLIAQRGDKPGRVELTDLLRASDFISLHCPLTDDTRGMLGPGELALMKNSAFLINCARGGIVDERAVLSALRSGEIAGAAFDVLEEEPPLDNVLLAQQLPNLIVTPHIAWASRNARQTVVEQIAENIAGFIAGSLTRQVLPA